MTPVSLLVPYRPDGGARDRIWGHLRARYEARLPAWEIVTAPGPDGPFCRAWAICDAAARAAGAIFVVVDADVWCEGIEGAVARAAAGAAWADPADRVVIRMTPAATEAALRGEPLSAKGAPRPLRRVACGGAVALSREAFFRCPPDRRFIGWGAEDKAWAADLERAFGPAAVGLRAPLWHFHHPPVADRQTSRASRRRLEAHLSGTASSAPAPGGG